jgi:fumarylpyruvate hydrolase
VTLRAGDIIMTGTPAGVGAVVRGDVIEGAIAGVGTVRTRVA